MRTCNDHFDFLIFRKIPTVKSIKICRIQSLKKHAKLSLFTSDPYNFVGLN